MKQLNRLMKQAFQISKPISFLKPITNKLAFSVVYAQVTLPDYTGTGFKFAGMTLGDVMTEVLKYIYPIAGVGLLMMMVWGGLEMMLSTGDQNKIKSGQGRITFAVAGFALIFLSYFVVQIVEVILHLDIL